MAAAALRFPGSSLQESVLERWQPNAMPTWMGLLVLSVIVVSCTCYVVATMPELTQKFAMDSLADPCTLHLICTA